MILSPPAIITRRTSSPDSIAANAPTGALHPPPRRCRYARSASTAACVDGSSIACTRARVSSSSARVSMPSAAWPTAGSISSNENTCVALSWSPRRVRPAIANTTASYSPVSTLRMRVSTLPRISAGSTSGRIARICTARRPLPVPMRAPGQDRRSGTPPDDTSASRGSARSGTAASTRPGASVAGRSFRLCTAMSASPDRNASSIAFVNTPRPPISASGAVERSPSVWISRSSSLTPGCAARSASDTISTCRSESLLPRAPMTKVRFMLALSVTVAPHPHVRIGTDEMARSGCRQATSGSPGTRWREFAAGPAATRLRGRPDRTAPASLRHTARLRPAASGAGRARGGVS